MNEKVETTDFSAVWGRVFGQAEKPADMAGQLAGFLRNAAAAEKKYAGLAARTGGKARQTLLALAAGERGSFKKLELEYYLCAGENCPPILSEAAASGPILEALRRQHGLELSNAKALEKSAALCGDQRLGERLRELAEEERNHARQVLGLLEASL